MNGDELEEPNVRFAGVVQKMWYDWDCTTGEGFATKSRAIDVKIDQILRNDPGWLSPGQTVHVVDIRATKFLMLNPCSMTGKHIDEFQIGDRVEVFGMAHERGVEVDFACSPTFIGKLASPAVSQVPGFRFESIFAGLWWASSCCCCSLEEAHLHNGLFLFVRE